MQVPLVVVQVSAWFLEEEPVGQYLWYHWKRSEYVAVEVFVVLGPQVPSRDVHLQGLLLDYSFPFKKI